MLKPSYVYNVTLLRVIDGDTFDFRIDLGFHTYIQERVRLYSIDTPETRGPNAEAAGTTATKWATEWLDAAKSLILHSLRYDAREKYGRVLGEIYRDEDPIPLGYALRAAGFAK